jgi:hypothetical protein
MPSAGETRGIIEDAAASCRFGQSMYKDTRSYLSPPYSLYWLEQLGLELCGDREGLLQPLSPVPRMKTVRLQTVRYAVQPLRRRASVHMNTALFSVISGIPA